MNLLIPNDNLFKNAESLPESGIKRPGSLRHRDRGIHQVFMEVRMW
jgi:hypothetical protein